jgi:probable addiction module antidote protein
MDHDIIHWDAADYLVSDGDIADYLAAAFETGDAADITHALATIARARGMMDLAGARGASRDMLAKAVGEGANPTLATLLALLGSLNFTLSIKPKVAAQAAS